MDELAPVWQFHEVHRIQVEATPEQTHAAIRGVTPREIRLFRTLTWLRRLGRAGPESILNPPADRPILEVATRTGFLLLLDSPPAPPVSFSPVGRGWTAGEVVVGTVVIAPRGVAPPKTADEFRRIDQPGYAKAVMNFRIEAAGTGCIVTTETRVHATDARTRRRFATYWWLIYPGSALIRRMWLRAIKKRAEGLKG